MNVCTVFKNLKANSTSYIAFGSLNISLHLRAVGVPTSLGQSDLRKQPKMIYIYYKSSYAVIRTPVYKPKSEDFEIMNVIAKHIKSAWFGG